MTERPLARLFLWAGILQVLAFLMYFSLSIYPLPRWDHYDWIAGYVGAGSKADWLWWPHNVHRIVPTKLAVLVDIELFQGRLIPIALIAVTTLVAWVATLLLTVRATAGLGREALILFTGIILVLAFQTFTLDNYTYPSNSQFTITASFYIAALSCLNLYANRTAGGPGWLLLCIMAAIICTVSSLNGLFVWPVLLWMSWKTRCHRAIVPVLLSGAAALIIYAQGMTGALPALDSAPGVSPWQYIRYLVAYFGMPWVTVPALSPVGFLAGTIVIALALNALLGKGFTRDGRQTLEEIGLGLLMFAGATALMTTAGRAAQFDLPAHRYTVFAVLAHVGLLCVYWPVVWRCARSLSDNRVGKAAVAGALCAVLLQQLAIGQFAYSRAQQFAHTRDQLLDGNRSARVIDKVYYDREKFRGHLALMASEKIYLFREPATGTPSPPK